jgi:hypothetical protein
MRRSEWTIESIKEIAIKVKTEYVVEINQLIRFEVQRFTGQDLKP